MAKTPSAEVVLAVKGLKVAYGGIQAVKGIDLEVRRGELVALIGANGAGKTTTLKAITGTLSPSAGDIAFDGRSIIGRDSFQLVGQGLGHGARHRVAGIGAVERQGQHTGVKACEQVGCTGINLALGHACLLICYGRTRAALCAVY